MKIYTKTGDKGMTSLIGGSRVSKGHPRIEAYGTVDELMAHVSYLRDNIDDEGLKDDLFKILDLLMTIASLLAAENEELIKGLPKILRTDIEWFEKKIDKMEEKLEPLDSFIIPGGHPQVSLCHIARTVCRRAERVTIRVSEDNDIPEYIIQFLNRLSDYLFVLSRLIISQLGNKEIKWVPKL